MSIKQPLISIITPCYNSGKYITETINSVIDQTYANWEHLIIDDYSTDNSVSLIQEMAGKDNRIKLIKLEKNGGAAVARNTGLKHIKGSFLCFLDSDDYWENEKLKIQLEYMIEHDCDISFTEYKCMNENFSIQESYVKVPATIDYKGYLKNTIIGMSTSMINLNKVSTFSFIDIRTRQDTYLWITLLKRGHIACGIKKSLAKYRIRKESISANKIKAAKKVWYLYFTLEKLGLIKSAYYFTFYFLNAIKKRIIH